VEKNRNKIIIAWLFSGLVLVLAMVVIGGITRLTHSGLSMVNWNLFAGAIPPLNEESWQSTFDNYKQFPEYLKLNQGMTLSEFKSIFFWEYLHRLIGRMLGLVFIIPFVFFIIKKWISKTLLNKLIVLLLLGALQGGLGWFMVKSGLVDRPSVSHFRLAIHLVAAFSLLVYIFWLILELTGVKKKSEPFIASFSQFLLIFAFIQIIYGAFVAGLKAGLICPTFPDMCGSFFPHSIATLDFLNEGANIQFLHRCFAWILFFAVIFLWKKIKDSRLDNKTGNLLLLSISIQFLLGVGTLLFHVPITLAVLHQLGAVFVLFALTNLIYQSKS
jgi:cytochrome c oxidase assembly protein subunit 15